jgi:hypothetical protein
MAPTVCSGSKTGNSERLLQPRIALWRTEEYWSGGAPGQAMPSGQTDVFPLYPFMIESICAAVKAAVTSCLHALMKFDDYRINLVNPWGRVAKHFSFRSFNIHLQKIDFFPGRNFSLS